MNNLTKNFIKKSISIHGKDKFIYDEVNYISIAEKISIICVEHGLISISPKNHLRGSGCPECGNKLRTKAITGGTEDFVKRSNLIHFGKYNYDKSVYTLVGNKVTITCPKHGDFEQMASVHLRGGGCMKCNNDKYGLNEFIAKSKEVHGEIYSFEKSVYVKSNVKIIITCPEHGDFETLPRTHLGGSSCPKCGRNRTTENNLLTLEEFISRSKELHKGKYGYDKSLYVKNNVNTVITCPEHGDFYQTPYNHLQLKGCPSCARESNSSKGEIELFEFIESIYKGEIIRNDRIAIINGELDIYLPELKLAFEYNGMYWHRDDSVGKSYHKNKHIKCLNKGINLVQIWDYEWENKIKKEIIKNIVRCRLNVVENKFYARKLKIKTVTIEEEKQFININHLQGYTISSVNLGLYNNSDLVQIMTLKNIGNNVFEIGRLCTKIGSVVVGGSERLFSKLLKTVDWHNIISYNNLEKFNGNVYSKLGMDIESSFIESYFYTNGSSRFSRQSMQKHKLLTKEFDPKLTGNEIAKTMGFFRVSTVGNSKYIITKQIK